MFEEQDQVRFTTDIPGTPVRRGDVGTIVYIHEEPPLRYDVELADPDGRTIARVTVTASQIEPLD